MDPNTVVVVLALNLISTGGLLFLIGRRLPPGQGLATMAIAAMVFGTAYLMRLAIGVEGSAFSGLLPDSAMVLSTWLFIGGLRQFVDEPSPGSRSIAFGLAVFVLVDVAVILSFGQQGRHALLNLTIGAAYALLSWVAGSGAQREVSALRQPLGVLSLLVGVLALATLARAGHAASQGVAPLFKGPWAQAYYAYAALSTVLLGPCLLWMVFVRLNSQLAHLATHDPLTHLLNRNGLREVVERHFGRRPADPLTLLQVDVDHFKRINDDHGHAAGDQVLAAVARALQGELRAGDFAARLGGEEFLVGCVGADAARAAALGERLRAAIASLQLAAPAGDAALRCTVSVGIARGISDAAQWDAALREADKALYAAKQGGRDRVVRAGTDGR